MRFSNRTLAGAALFVAGLIAAAPLAEASEWNKKTILKVDETIEVPGATLDPGTYVVQLVDIQSNRHVVQFKNEAEDEVISTVIAIPNYRMDPTGDTEFAWYETASAQPPALRAWFYPGDNFGQEFVYDEQRSQQLAQGSQNVVTVDRTAEDRQADADLLARQQQMAAQEEEARRQQEMERQNAELAQQQREAEAREREEARRLEEQRQREIAEQQRQQQERMLAEQRAREQREREERERELTALAEQRQQQTRTELPQTGGVAPLLGLLSLLSLGSAAGLGALRRR